jgi:hypothetical protein
MFIQKSMLPSSRSLVTHSGCTNRRWYSLSVAGLVKRLAYVHVPYEPVSIQRMSCSRSS